MTNDGRCASGCSDFVDDVCTVCGFVDPNFEERETARTGKADAFAWFWAQVAIACLCAGYKAVSDTVVHIGKLAADAKYTKAKLGIDVSQRRILGVIAWNVLKLSERGIL